MCLHTWPRLVRLQSACACLRAGRGASPTVLRLAASRPAQPRLLTLLQAPRSSLLLYRPVPQNRYLIILYYNSTRHKQKLGLKDQEAELRRMQEKHGVDGEQHPRAKK